MFGDVKVPVALYSPLEGDQQYPLHAFYRTDWFNADQDHEIADICQVHQADHRIGLPSLQEQYALAGL